jgi:hypothetical protein
MWLYAFLPGVPGTKCYDFQNIFAEKFGEKNSILLLKLLLVFEKRQFFRRILAKNLSISFRVNYKNRLNVLITVFGYF